MSGPATRSQRARRARVMVVGDAALSQSVTQLLAQPATSAHNVFEAMGAIASSGAQDPVAAVILAEAFTAAPHQHAIEALRRIDPAVRIVAVTHRTDVPTAAGGTHDPDAWIAAALRPEDLRRALDDDGLLAPAGSPGGALAVPATGDDPMVIDLDATEATPVVGASEPTIDENRRSPDGRAVRSAPDVESRTTPPPSPGLERSVDAAPPIAEALPCAGKSIGAAAPTAASVAAHPSIIADQFGGSAGAVPTPAATIGDTDLLHALLRSEAGVLPLALQLIAHHGGWSGVRLVESDDPDLGGVEVLCAGHRHGRLLADGAQPGRLRPWADWLGHWLHMEQELRRLRRQAHCDDLTGAWNRRFFESFLAQTIDQARSDRRAITVMFFDIDNFKTYNDRFGHEAGDAILCEIVRLLKSIVRQGDIVCRIGGDEFIVVFADPEAPRTPGSKHPESIESIARRIQQAVCTMRFPKLGEEGPGSLSISAGLATFPWDGQDPATLLRQADQRALESKRRGKNAITLGPAAGEQAAST